MKHRTRKTHRATSVQTTSGLARALNLSRETIRRLLSLPGCPRPQPGGSYDIPKLRAFAEQEGIGRRRSPEKAALELRRMQLDIDRRTLALERERGETIRRAEVVEIVVHAVTLFREHLEAKFLVELPPLYTTDAPSNQELNERALNLALEEFCRDLWAIFCNQFAASDAAQLAIFESTVSQMRASFSKVAPGNATRLTAPPQTGRPLGS